MINPCFWPVPVGINPTGQACDGQGALLWSYPRETYQVKCVACGARGPRRSSSKEAVRTHNQHAELLDRMHLTTRERV